MNTAKLTYTPRKIAEFQNAVDKTVDELGVERTTQLLNLFHSFGTNRDKKSKPYSKLISGFIIAEVCGFFQITEVDLYTHEKNAEYREIRMICFKLIYDYGGMSRSAIARLFENVERRQVLYYCQKCEEQLSASNFYKTFNYKFREIQNRVLPFVEKVNHDG